MPDQSKQNPVIIAGAGPVGLTLALLLHENGIPVEIYETVSEIRPLGVGINLLPHSVRVLHGLGLEAQLDEFAIRTSALNYCNKFGQQIWSEPRGIDAGYPFPQYSIHRGNFQIFLSEIAQERIGKEHFHFGHTLVDWRNSSESIDENSTIDAIFRDQEGNNQSVIGRCLVAADGINSNARKKLYPNEGDPIYGGRILWRGVTKAKPFLDGRTMFMAGHQDCKFVAYPICKASHDDGNSLINWIAELSLPDWTPELQDWNREVPVEKFAQPFADWNFDWVNIPQLIDNAEKVFEFPLSDRNPVPSWRDGLMTLIGDAAHPMYPIGSNGASQGILDAEKLASELCIDQSMDQALARYEEDRRPATAQIVLLNRKNGPEQVMQLAEERAPDGFNDIEDVIPMSERQDIADRYKQTAGFNLQAVKNKSQKK
ncbi:flavin-dependent oxidoreductase [Aurantivibrio infirmus]